MGQKAAGVNQYNETLLRELYYKMRLIRVFEDAVEDLINAGELLSDAHLMQGQEATAVGATAVLEEEDYITSTHRPHGHVLGMGIDPNSVMAEIGGKETGISGGRGGEMHMFDPSNGIIGSNGMVGGSLPHAAGAVLASQMDGEERVAIGFFGDGAINQGVVHETMNLAAVWNLPILFLCENNRYAVSVPVEKSSGVEHLSERAAGYGMPGKTIDGQDVLEVYKEVGESIESIRSGEGPQLIEAETYRYLDHTAASSRLASYRSDAEIENYREADPVYSFADTLIDGGVLSEAEIDSINTTVEQDVEDATEHMKASDFPPAEEAANHFYQAENADELYQPRYR
jgi:pyruvate dehydrogenase E1 component alpha subunit